MGPSEGGHVQPNPMKGMKMKLIHNFTLLAVLLLAIGPLHAEKATKGQNEVSFKEQLQKGNRTEKVKAAEILSERFPASLGEIESAMDGESDPETRRRIAQVLTAKHGRPRAVAILKDSMRKSDIKTHAGAFAFVMSAMAIKQGTGEVSGTKEALQLVAGPAKFADVENAPLGYVQRDGVRVMAASYLIDNLEPGKRAELEGALRSYVHEVEGTIGTSAGRDRRYWEARLTTLLEMALRAGITSLPLEFESKQNLLQEKYEKERLQRALEKAHGKQK